MVDVEASVSSALDDFYSLKTGCSPCFPQLAFILVI